jgi:hypothetical protein
MSMIGARYQQLEFDRRDIKLTRHARLKTPRIRHWWGRRYRDGHNGAWCYLCHSFIATWSRRWPITEGARNAIALHRDEHITALLDGATTQPEEK